MVAVVPSTPKPHQAAHPGRSPKPAGADFGRLLEEAADQHRPAPEAAPEEAATAPESLREDRAPDDVPDAAPVDQTAEETPATAPEAADQDLQEKPATKDPAGAPLPAAPQTFVPLAPAPAPEVLAKVEVASAPTEEGRPAPAPAPVARSFKAQTPTGTQPTPRQAKGQEPDLRSLEAPSEALHLDPDSPWPENPAHAGGQHSSATLLNFDELMRPDLKTDVSPEPALDQLQQAMNAALLDENAQLVMPQVVRGLATLVSEGVSEMRLQLMPEDLGEIELRVRTSEGVVRGEMMVQRPEIKQLLDQHLDRLRSALHQQGLDLRGFDIGLAPEGRFAQPDRSGHGSQPQRGPRGRGSAEAAPEAVQPALAPRGALAVDYLA